MKYLNFIGDGHIRIKLDMRMLHLSSTINFNQFLPEKVKMGRRSAERKGLFVRVAPRKVCLCGDVGARLACGGTG